MIRSTEEWEMSRSCQSATFSSAAAALPRRTRARPDYLLGLDRVALVGHRARALLAAAERLAHLADLGAGEVPQLGREPLECRRRRARSPQQLGVAVARYDLGGDRLAREPEAGESTRSSNSGDVAE